MPPWSQAWQRRELRTHGCHPPPHAAARCCLPQHIRQGQDGASNEKRELCWGCAGAVLGLWGLNSTKITAGGQDLEESCFLLPHKSPLCAGSFPTAFHCSLGTHLGCSAPHQPPPPHPTAQLPFLTGLLLAASKHPPLPPTPCTQNSLMLCSPKSISGSFFQGDSPGCWPGRGGWSHGAGAVLPHASIAAPSKPPPKLHRDSSTPAREQSSVGTTKHLHPLPSAKPLPHTMSFFVLSSPPSLLACSLHRFPAPYSHQCHQLLALLGDRGGPAGQVLLVALSKGEKGGDPRSERNSQTPPRGAGGQRELRTLRSPLVCAGHPPWRAGSEWAPQGARALPSPRHPPLPREGAIQGIPLDVTTTSPPPAQFLPLQSPLLPCCLQGSSLDRAMPGLARCPLGSGCQAQHWDF